MVKIPTSVKSIASGLTLGVGAFASWRAFHGIKYTHFNKNLGPWESRERYHEKQQIFEAELEEKLAAQKTAAAVAFYNPVDARTPIGNVNSINAMRI